MLTQGMHDSRNTSSARRIDTHAHLVPDFYRGWLLEKGVDAGGLPIPIWSVQSTLEFMEANEIETSILSVATPGVEPGELNEARQMARRLNEFAAMVVSENPHRFGFFATLMLPDVDGSLAKLLTLLITSMLMASYYMPTHGGFIWEIRNSIH
jgi:hypothetical protein